MEFEYSGGVIKPGRHDVSKFMLFFVVNGQEIPLYQLVRDGIVMRKHEGRNVYITGLQYAKIFTGHSGFGIRKRYHSFYFRLLEGEQNIVTINPFCEAIDTHYFKGPIRFLKNSEVEQLLAEENPSKRFIKYQEPLAVDTLHRMVTVERVKLRDVRHVRIKTKLRRK